MKKIHIILTTSLIAGAVGFLAAALFLPHKLLDDYNDMASDNFHTALAIFRDGYKQNHLMFFGEKNEVETFKVGNITFSVYPDFVTTSDESNEVFNQGIGNAASHINSMIVMLAAKWIEDDNPAGDELLNKLVEYIPNFKISSPDISPVKIQDLEKSSPMLDSEASQWQWRMEYH